MRGELLALSKARLADLVTELWDQNARMRGRLVKQQKVIEGLVERVKGYEEDDRMRG